LKEIGTEILIQIEFWEDSNWATLVWDYLKPKKIFRTRIHFSTNKIDTKEVNTPQIISTNTNHLMQLEALVF
jgi:hypothetical protein